MHQAGVENITMHNDTVHVLYIHVHVHVQYVTCTVQLQHYLHCCFRVIDCTGPVGLLCNQFLYCSLI